MIPQRWIEAYLRFLLRYRGTVTIVVTIFTLIFCVFLTRMHLHTDFLDFYPKYRTFSDAFGECREQGKERLQLCRPGDREAGAEPVHQDLHRL
jgi:predicted RND superfamily exporter protein